MGCARRRIHRGTPHRQQPMRADQHSAHHVLHSRERTDYQLETIAPLQPVHGTRIERDLHHTRVALRAPREILRRSKPVVAAADRIGLYRDGHASAWMDSFQFLGPFVDRAIDGWSDRSRCVGASLRVGLHTLRRTHPGCAAHIYRSQRQCLLWRHVAPCLFHGSLHPGTARGYFCRNSKKHGQQQRMDIRKLVDATKRRSVDHARRLLHLVHNISARNLLELHERESLKGMDKALEQNFAMSVHHLKPLN